MIDRLRETGMRRAPRLATQLSGTLIGRNRLPVQLLDLSQRGCLVRCANRLDRGMILDLELFIDGEAFVAKVRAADSSRDGENSTDEATLYLTGLEFLSLTPQGDLLLRRFIERERRRQLQSGA